MLASLAIAFGYRALIATKTSRTYWPLITLSATALLLSADEAAMLHERLDGVALWLGINLSWGYQWVAIGVPVAVLAGVVLLWLARSVDPVLRKRLVIAGIVFLLGAIGGEVLSGVIIKLDLGLSNSLSYIAHSGAIFIEETLEICGAVLALRAALIQVPAPLSLLSRGEPHAPDDALA